MDHYLNGNPAMAEILRTALEAIDSGIEPSPVGKVVLREWLSTVAARRNELELKSMNGFLTDDEYAELSACRISLQTYGGSV